MKNFTRSLKISGKLILFNSAAVLAVLAALTAVVIVQVNRLALDDARQLARKVAEHESTVVKAELETALDEARALKDVFESAANIPALTMTRRKANLILEYFIEKNPGFLGVYVGFEPDAFGNNDRNFAGDAGHDETGRFIPYWTRSWTTKPREPGITTNCPRDATGNASSTHFLT